ncbi:hypothetical protein PUNSTDRAFT_108833 [Punctularia strigosozonata HHB-11173 SS5]|uniref:Uncharacterized protein n=1 Tax=Punctularia strigosozonata (strain HHB-11173) TaxID=741275 RepID=R7S431_PUNST|nr:uncharacterized protein PUNSTDRAFT_108833 [Punctularia strigosozonata HHB-11173 SS5]EIN03996.1 hypothetical protein PUNSTDRAFT_108833 [Punctularia strigosozonata HHB-11173 SS5]
MVRFKNRWLLVEFIPYPDGLLSTPSVQAKETLNGKLIFAALKQSVLQNFGDSGWGAVGYSLTVKYYSPTTRLCIIRVGREHVRTAWGALTLLNSIEGQRVIPNVIHVSGTIKHAQIAAIEHNRVVIARYRAIAKTPAGYTDSYEAFLETTTNEINALQD